MTNRNRYPPNYIKMLREARGWTLRDLEIKTGWSNQTLSNLELSKADLTWSKTLKLAEIFECHPLDVLQGPGAAAGPKDQRERDLLKTYRGLEDGAKNLFDNMVDGLKKRSDEEAIVKKDSGQRK